MWGKRAQFPLGKKEVPQAMLVDWSRVLGCGRTHHGVLQQVLQPRQARVVVAGIFPLDGVLQVPQVRLRLPGVAEELRRQKGSQEAREVPLSSLRAGKEHPKGSPSSS